MESNVLLGNLVSWQSDGCHMTCSKHCCRPSTAPNGNITPPMCVDKETKSTHWTLCLGFLWCCRVHQEVQLPLGVFLVLNSFWVLHVKCQPHSWHSGRWSILINSPVSGFDILALYPFVTSQKTHLNSLTSGFRVQWECVQLAFSPGSNEPALVPDFTQL